MECTFAGREEGGGRVLLQGQRREAVSEESGVGDRGVEDGQGEMVELRTPGLVVEPPGSALGAREALGRGGT